MPDRILSTLVYTAATNSYTNLAPGVSPLILNDTGDLIFNTNNLALYNTNSNNRIIRPTGYQSWAFPTILDNAIIGGNNSVVYGRNQTILNSDSSMVSGEHLQDDLNTYTCYNSIIGSVSSTIKSSYGGMILNSFSSEISGGIWQSILNSYGSLTRNTTCTSLISTWYSNSFGTINFYNGTGGLYATERGGYGSLIIGGVQNSFSEKNADRSAFTGVLAFNGTYGTGYLSGVTNFYSAYGGSNKNLIFGGENSSIITASQSAIISSSRSRICGPTNIAYIGGPVWGGDVACWRGNGVNAVLGGACALIADQAEQSVILGGCCNTIRGGFYPHYYRHDGLLYNNNRLTTASVILGGFCNILQTGSSCSAILGGLRNTIWSGRLQTIGNGDGNILAGGVSNTILNGQGSVICNNGTCNTILNGGGNSIGQSSGKANLIGNGCNNLIASNPTTTGSCFNIILNGRLNCNSSNSYSSIINGCNNKITSATSCHTLINAGSDHCIAENAQYSYILGGLKARILASHSGAAILADGQNRNHDSSGAHTLTLDFANGIYFSAPTGFQPQIYGTLNFQNRPQVSGINILLQGDSSLSTQIFNIPDNKNANGTKGQFAISGNYFYFCKENNSWVRTALSEW